MRIDKYNKKLLKELEEKYGLSEQQVMEILKAPSLFIREKTKGIELKKGMTEEEFYNATYNFNIPMIGKLYTSYNNYKKYHDRRRKKGDSSTD